MLQTYYRTVARMSQNKTDYLIKLGEKIKKCREVRGLSQAELARQCGYTSRSSINRIESGVSDISRDKFAKLAEVLGVSPVELMDVDGSIKNNAVATSVPVMDYIVDGIPVEMNKIISYEDIPQRLTAYNDYFAYKMPDYSMVPQIEPGDILIIRMQDHAVDGELVVASVGSAPAVCRMYKKENGCEYLVAFNWSLDAPQVTPISSNNKLHIIGRVVELRRKYE